MSPPRKKPGAVRKANPNLASPAAVGDLQGLIDQVQALRRRHKAHPSAQSAAELVRLREALLEALDLDEDDEEEEEDVDAPGELSDEDSEAAFMDGVEDEIWEEDESGEWRSRRDWTRFRPAPRGSRSKTAWSYEAAGAPSARAGGRGASFRPSSRS